MTFATCKLGLTDSKARPVSALGVRLLVCQGHCDDYFDISRVTTADFPVDVSLKQKEIQFFLLKITFEYILQISKQTRKISFNTCDLGITLTLIIKQAFSGVI